MSNVIAGALDEERVDDDPGAAPRSSRWVDRLDPRLVNLLTVLGFGVPLVGYFWLLRRYSVNVIVSDQLSDLTVIGRSYGHVFDWGSLWAQHNENRILFPNLIVVLLAHTTRFNVQVEEYLSAVMLVAATAFLILAHKRRSPTTPWLYYCPVALLALSVVQYGNALWGFQMAWYLVLLALATTILLIDRISLTWVTLGAAIATAVIGSFSSLQGLLIWPAGLVLLYHRRRKASHVAAWIIAAAASLVIYLYHFDPNAGSPRHNYVLQYPMAAIKFYVFAIGDIVGVPQKYNGPGNNAVLLLGLVIIVLAVLTIVAYGIRRDEQRGSPVGVALVCVGLLFAGTVTAGRIIFGYSAASQSRYTTYDLLIPIGIFLAVLDRPLLSRGRSRSGAPSVETGRSADRYGPIGARLRVWADGAGIAVVRGILAVVIGAQIVVGLHYGIQGAQGSYAYDVRAVPVLKNIDHSSDEVVVFSLDLFSKAPFIRRQARIAQQHHLNVFAEPAGPSPPAGTSTRRSTPTPTTR